MIIEIGYFALQAALICSLLQIVIVFVEFFVRPSKEEWGGNFLTTNVLLLILLAFSALLYAYITSDFSVANVVQNSHEALPLIFKITALWGNHEGSMLLFILILSFFTWLFAHFKAFLRQKWDAHFPSKVFPDFLKIALTSQHALISAFLAFLLFTSNPFLRLSSVAATGADLNPLLQDIGLILHPPLLYFGFAGFSVVFSLAIACLVTGWCENNLGNLIRPWLLLSWSALTLGISFGSYWAYYELGWGGYWFWDPVENASLMPWLIACALIHCSRILAKRGHCRLWTLLLSIFTFSLALLGTFLVRADVLLSVHNFVSLPSRSFSLLLIVIFFSGGALLLFALRAPRIETETILSPLSREGALIFNNIFLCTACATILIGTLYPMIVEALWNEKISVGPPFFNMMFACLMLPILIIMPLGPFLGWKYADIATAFERLGLAVAASLAIIITGALLSEKTDLASVNTVAMLGLACWLIVGAVCDLFYHVGIGKRSPEQFPKSEERFCAEIALQNKQFVHKSFSKAAADTFIGFLRRLRALPLGVYGRCLAHGGVGITLAGIVAVSSFSDEAVTALQIGQELTIQDKILRFERILPHLGANYLEDKVEFSLWEKQDKEFIGSVYASRRFFLARNIETSEIGLFWHGLSQFYIAAGHFDEKGALIVQVWYKSYVLAIWLGGFFMAAGGLLALLDGLKLYWKNRKDKTPLEQF